MRIAQLAPLFLEVPPREYGGTERIVHTLTEQLVKRGHDVTLFAAQGSTTTADLYPMGTLPLWETGGNAFAWHAIEIEELIRHSADFDVIHSHLEVLPWLGGERYQSPLVTTIHGRLDLDEQRQVLKVFRQWPLVSISDAQRCPVDDLGLDWLATVYHGLDLEGVYSQGAGAGGYLAFISRFSPEKGPDVAIRAARKAGMKLVMAGPIPDENREFFEAEVEPLLKDSDVELVGSSTTRARTSCSATPPASSSRSSGMSRSASCSSSRSPAGPRSSRSRAVRFQSSSRTAGMDSW